MELITLETKSPIEVFGCNATEDILNKIESEARKSVPDIESAKGRKEIASIARKVSSTKVLLDNLGKDLVSDWKSTSKLVDAERKEVRDRLDLLRDEIRNPLTEWEANEAAIAEAARLKIERDMDHTTALKDNELFDQRIELERKAAELDRIKAEQVEKERLEAERQQRAERDKQIAEQAKIKAEQAAADEIERVKQEHANQLAREAAERERIAREEQAKEAQRQQIILDDKAREERIQHEATEKERLRTENLTHRKKINNAIVAAFVGTGTDEDVAKALVTKIAKGEIENITIDY